MSYIDNAPPIDTKLMIVKFFQIQEKSFRGGTKMKRILVFLIALLAILAVACNGEPTNNGNNNSGNNAGSGQSSSTDDTSNFLLGYSYGDYAGIFFEIEKENTVVPETLVIPEEYEGLPVKYFYVYSSCDSVKAVVLSKNIEAIIYSSTGGGEESIFPNLNRYDVTSENEFLCSVDGVIFSKDMKKIIRAPFAIGDYSIPNGVESIEQDAFDRCSKMQKVTIPSSVVKINEHGAFGGCSSLNEFILESNEHFISENGMLIEKYPGYNNTEELYLIAFPSAKGVVTIPDSVVTSRGAFKRCKELTSVIIPESVEYIQYNAFYRCSGLTSISLPQSLKKLSGSGLGNFKGCTSLTSIEIPASVSSISPNDFLSCNNLSINVVDDNPYFSSQDGVLFNKDKTELLSYPAAKNKYVIPATVTTIGTWAFANCKVEEIIIPDSVTTIGHGAFDECNNIRSITIPSTVTTIGPNAFITSKDLVVSFEGTKEQWNNIEKGIYIFINTKQVIHCSDGDITI